MAGVIDQQAKDSSSYFHHQHAILFFLYTFLAARGKTEFFEDDLYDLFHNRFIQSGHHAYM
jgi:hypothetical protein